MIKIDDFLYEFLKYNLLTVNLVLVFLKGLAKITKSTVDDKIVTLISNFFSSVKGKK